MTTISDERLADAEWLEQAARYFEKRGTGGEDMAFWANVANAERCRSIAQSLRAQGGVRVKPYVKRNAPGHDDDGGEVVVPFKTDAEMRRILSALEPQQKEAVAVEWWCEEHLHEPMNHDGCNGAGVWFKDREALAVNQLRHEKQRSKEALEQASLYAPSLEASPAPVSEEMVEALWCESCGEAEQTRHTEYAGLCESCWKDAGQPK